MSRFLVVSALAFGAFLFAGNATAQAHEPNNGVRVAPYNGGRSVNFNVQWGYNNYRYNFYNRPHIDYVPGHLDRHHNHYHYVPAHQDLHINGRKYAIDPWTGRVSPFPHRD